MKLILQKKLRKSNHPSIRSQLINANKPTTLTQLLLGFGYLSGLLFVCVCVFFLVDRSTSLRSSSKNQDYMTSLQWLQWLPLVSLPLELHLDMLFHQELPLKHHQLQCQ